MFQRALRSSKAALDLASILIGVVILGLIGGVVAATVMVVIPWAQDTSAQNALRSLSSAQESYKLAYDQYANYSKLVENSLINQDPSLCSIVSNDGTNYGSAAISNNGTVYANTNMNPDPVEVNVGDTTCFGVMVAAGTFVNPPTETDPVPYLTTTGYDTSGSVTAGGGNTLNPGAVVPAPGVASSTATSLDNVTVFTYNCPTTRTVSLPVRGLYGVAVWSDGEYNTYSGTNSNNITKNLVGGRNYTVTLTGSFRSMFASTSMTASQECLRTVSAWGADTGTTSASYAFRNAVNLTSVATPPATITNMSGMFYNANRFNQSLNNWNTGNVTDMSNMFAYATSFNGAINNWDVSQVTTMSNMFNEASAFNQPLNNWDTSSVTDMSRMFFYATSFNRNINTWNVSNVTTMSLLFYRANAFNQPLNNWNTGNVTTLQSTFAYAITFNQNINTWNVSNVTTMSQTFSGAYAFNQPLNNWNTQNVTTMQYMFSYTPFNQNINSWNTGRVTSLKYMFLGNFVYNQPMNNWNTSSMVDLQGTFIYTPFNQNINSWNVSNVTNMSSTFTQSNFNQPLNNWDTRNVTTMASLFAGSNVTRMPFNQNISGWNVSNVTDWSRFRENGSIATGNMPPKFR